MSSPKEWSFGDRVIHAKRPEWGAGVVTAAQKIVHEGAPCQRLTVRFDRAGVKTLSTAVAELVPATDSALAAISSQAAAESAQERDWQARLHGGSVEEIMSRLPEAATDPFASLESRLAATFALYRFTDTGGSLLDWAAAQSGLKDPLSEFSRHDLERLFQRFAFARDEHLKKLVQEYRKRDAAGLPAILRSAPPLARQALRRLDIWR